MLIRFIRSGLTTCFAVAACVVAMGLGFGPETLGSRPLTAQTLPKADSDQNSVLRSCFDFGAWLSMDHDALAKRVGDAVRNHPQDPATMVLLMLYREAIEESSTPDIVGEAVRDAIRAAKGDVARALGVNSRPLLEHLNEVATRRGWWDDAVMCQKCWFGLQDWLMAGPFASWGEGDMIDVPLGPEAICSLTQPMSGGFGAVTWRKWSPETPLDIEVSPSEVSSRGGNGWFMLTELNNPGPKRRVLLDVYSGTGGMKVWHNGTMVMRRRQVRDLSRDDVAIIDLPSGKSSLLIKMGQESTVTVRICDPITRLTMPDIASRVPEAADFQAFVPTGNVSPLSERWPPTFQPIARQYEELVGDGDERSMLATALALVASDGNAPELAEDCWKASERWRLADPIRDAALGALYFDRNTVHSPEAERRELRTRLEFLVGASPTYTRPRLELAKILGEEDQDAQAAKLLTQAIEARPHWSVYLAAAEYYSRKDWQAESRDLRLRAFAEPNPTPPLLRDQSEFQQTDLDEDASAKSLDAMLTMWPGSNTAIWKRFGLALRRSEFALAERLIAVEVRRIGGESIVVRSSRARLALAKGDWRAAKTIYDALAALPNRYPEYLSATAAEIAHRYGTREEAIAAWQRVQTLSPSSDKAMQALASLNGKATHPWPSQFTPVTHELLGLATAEDFPKSGHAVILDEEVWEVNQDGSATRHGQRLVKVLRQEAVDQIGRDWISGEVVRAHTMLPDGGFAEPASVTGNSFEFPKVAPGVAIDTAWTTSLPASDKLSFGGQQFAFRESDPAIPTLRSRLVLIIPQNIPSAARLRGKGSELIKSSTRILDDGRMELTWELSQPQSFSYEPSMPSTREIMPVIEFTRVNGDNSLSSQARNLLASIPDPQVTWLIREKTQLALVAAEKLNQSNQKMRESISEAVKLPQVYQSIEASELYRWVNQNIRGAGGGHHPHSTLVENAGDREALFLAMLDAAKIPYRLIRIGGNPALREVDGIAAPPLHRRLVLVPTKRTLMPEDTWDHCEFADWKLIDFANRMAPFAALGRGVEGASGISINPATLTWEPFKVSSSDGLRHGNSLTATIALPSSADDDAEISGKWESFGDASWHEREDAEFTSKARNKIALEAQLSDSIAGLSLDEVETDTVVTPGTQLAFWKTFKGNMSGAMQADGNDFKIALPLEKVSSMFAGAASLPNRTFDLLLTSTQDESSTITFQAPAGFAWTAPPRDLSVATGPLTYHLAFQLDGQSLTISRSLEIRPWRIPVGEYSGFRALLDGIEKAEASSLTLTKIAR